MSQNGDMNAQSYVIQTSPSKNIFFIGQFFPYYSRGLILSQRKINDMAKKYQFSSYIFFGNVFIIP